MMTPAGTITPSDFYRQKKSADDLIASARNFCDKTEAYYFLAMYALMKNNAEQAAGLFNKVLLLKDYSSTQYVGAKQILQVLAQ